MTVLIRLSVMTKEKLYGKTLNELIAVTKRIGLPAYSARQIADWLYKKEITSVDEIDRRAQV